MLFYVLLGLQIQTNHIRTFFKIIQNGGINQDDGFQSPIFEKFPKFNDRKFFRNFNKRIIMVTKIQNGDQKSRWRLDGHFFT
jgi:hypothetical protein